MSNVKLTINDAAAAVRIERLVLKKLMMGNVEISSRNRLARK